MVAAPTINKGRGRPTFEPWERLRASAWAYEVLNQAQNKMEEKSLTQDDPFYVHRKWLEDKLNIPQRHEENIGKITMTDLGQIFFGDRMVMKEDKSGHEKDVIRTDFYKYATGEGAGIKQSTIECVDEALPGTRYAYDIGPEKVPLWAALIGNITVEDFWKPLARSGQVDDALELKSSSHSLGKRTDIAYLPPEFVTTKSGQLTPMSIKDVLSYESETFLPNLSLQNVVRGMMQQLSEDYFHQSLVSYDNRAVDISKANIGVVTLSIAIAKLAIVDPQDLLLPEEDWFNPSEPKSFLDHLLQILIGLLPFAENYDNAHAKHGYPKVKLYLEVKDVISELSGVAGCRESGRQVKSEYE